MKAVFLDQATLDDLDVTLLQAEFDQLQIFQTSEPSQVAKRLENMDVVITNKAIICEADIAANPNLKLICVVATGTNNVDISAANKHGVVVCNCVAYGVASVVQHVWSMILALHTRLVDYDGVVKSGCWSKASQFTVLPHPIIELKGRTLGIIGYGHLGRAVADIAPAFGMNVIIGELPGREVREGRVSFEELVTRADVVSLHCPLTEETINLFDSDVLAVMKTSAMLINSARGGIVNEQALADALNRGDIAGAAVDVLTEEPPVNGNPLLVPTTKNLIVTPHSAWGSREARQRIIEQTVENIKGFKRGGITRQVR